MGRPAAVVAVLVLWLGWAAGAAAQSYQQVETRGFVAPEITVTRFDTVTSGLVGVSAGTIQGGKLLFGAAVRTRAFGASATHNLTYGGVLFGWMFNGDQRASIVARALVGYGRIVVRDRGRAFDYSDGLTFVALEPEAGVSLQSSDQARLLALIGYRVGPRANSFEPSASGVSVTTAIQFVF